MQTAIPNKVCPVLLLERGGVRYILAFRHPAPGAGTQIIKGTIEPGEPPERAVLRELEEESGIADASIVRHLGTWVSGYEDQVWSFHLCEAHQVLPEQWDYYCEDAEGHFFSFFWHPLHVTPGDDWFPTFRQALAYIQEKL